VPPHWRVDFWVADCEATAAKAEELGGKVMMPPTEAAGFRSAALADPQGAAFTVSQLRAA
jgi:predicted enzyme related to lactoylglutathione lyase